MKRQQTMAVDAAASAAARRRCRRGRWGWPYCCQTSAARPSAVGASERQQRPARVSGGYLLCGPSPPRGPPAGVCARLVKYGNGRAHAPTRSRTGGSTSRYINILYPPLLTRTYYTVPGCQEDTTLNTVDWGDPAAARVSAFSAPRRAALPGCLMTRRFICRGHGDGRICPHICQSRQAGALCSQPDEWRSHRRAPSRGRRRGDAHRRVGGGRADGRYGRCGCHLVRFAGRPD